MQFTQLTHQCMSHKLPTMVEVSNNTQWDDHNSTIKAVVALTLCSSDLTLYMLNCSKLLFAFQQHQLINVCMAPPTTNRTEQVLCYSTSFGLHSPPCTMSHDVRPLVSFHVLLLCYWKQVTNIVVLLTQAGCSKSQYYPAQYLHNSKWATIGVYVCK